MELNGTMSSTKPVTDTTGLLSGLNILSARREALSMSSSQLFTVQTQTDDFSVDTRKGGGDTYLPTNRITTTNLSSILLTDVCLIRNWHTRLYWGGKGL
mmetsp:Transcript_5965/g.9046  ORF Transcript_5965/g.9046 Transcript_5965/m.9046 type:complete len:99 (+) Transcript_5965:82-378(+)